MLTVLSEIRPLLNILCANFNEISVQLCNNTRNNWLNIWGDLSKQIRNPGNMGVTSCLGGGLHSLSALVNLCFG